MGERTVGGDDSQAVAEEMYERAVSEFRSIPFAAQLHYLELMTMTAIESGANPAELRELQRKYLGIGSFLEIQLRPTKQGKLRK